MKTLILYTTKYGCAEKAAAILKTKLAGEVSMANIKKERIPELEQYDAIVLGGSIYMGNIQKEMKEYAAANLSTLLKKKVGLFICAGSPDLNAREKELEASFPSELFNHAAGKEVLGGEITYEKLSFLERTIMKAVKGDKNSTSDLSQEKIEELAKAIS